MNVAGSLYEMEIVRHVSSLREGSFIGYTSRLTDTGIWAGVDLSPRPPVGPAYPSYRYVDGIVLLTVDIMLEVMIYLDNPLGVG